MTVEEIKELRELKKQQEKLEKKYNDLIKPILTDTSLIDDIYKVFCEVMDERCCPPRKGSIRQTKRFLFVIMNLYSPRVFCGMKMYAGIRKKLSSVLGYEKSPTAIGNLCRGICDQYLLYKDTSEDLSQILSQVSKVLKERGYI